MLVVSGRVCPCIGTYFHIPCPCMETNSAESKVFKFIFDSDTKYCRLVEIGNFRDLSYFTSLMSDAVIWKEKRFSLHKSYHGLLLNTISFTNKQELSMKELTFYAVLKTFFQKTEAKYDRQFGSPELTTDVDIYSGGPSDKIKEKELINFALRLFSY